MKRTLFFSSLILTTSIAQSGTYDPTDLTQAYTYLNQVRLAAGMTEFSKNPLLEKSASNHANYLADNATEGHFETAGKLGFTGVEPKDRTKHAGYPSLSVSENVSTGNPNSTDSIDGLMGAIYHRIGFLDFVNNEVGIGIAHVSNPEEHTAYVYNLGNSKYGALCAGPSFEDEGSYYYDVCEPNINIDAVAFDEVTRQAQGNNPTVVLWPTEGDKQVPPAFFEESPDPLPDYSVSGYPISIQFNPLSFKAVKVSDFKLYRDPDSSEIKSTRQLNKKTDPNEKLTALEFVLFPLERLDWNTAYRVEAKYTDDAGKENTLTWHFQTRGAGAPLFTVTGKGEELSVPLTAKFAIYVPPTKQSAEIGSLNFSFSSGMKIDTNFIDANTFLIDLSGKEGQTAEFKFSEGRSFKVTLKTDATLPTDTSETPSTPVTPVPATLPTLTDPYAVNGKGKSVKTKTQFAGGIAVNGSEYQKQVVQMLSDPVEVKGEIKVDSANVGKKADLFVYAETSLPPDLEVYYFMLGEGGELSLWDQQSANLVPFQKEVKLGKTQTVTMYQGTFAYPGTLKVHFGYRLTDGTMVSHKEAIEITINR